MLSPEEYLYSSTKNYAGPPEELIEVEIALKKQDMISVALQMRPSLIPSSIINQDIMLFGSKRKLFQHHYSSGIDYFEFTWIFSSTI